MSEVAVESSIFKLKNPPPGEPRRWAGRTFGASQTGLFLGKLHLCRAFLRFARHPHRIAQVLRTSQQCL
ncbi:hypothetical protein LF1_36760 [Rubripirellula obstinata]|uniref:Uncharacterized protein n=1 Tax=Rubripirellula obstinata TaxID=406547 RepID=A0A5B1CLB9_9BACT|nr:hypothetical protein LF1_36760 [Rubripirellula obstinata]